MKGSASNFENGSQNLRNGAPWWMTFEPPLDHGHHYSDLSMNLRFQYGTSSFFIYSLILYVYDLRQTWGLQYLQGYQVFRRQF